VGPRDGLQNESQPISTADKIRLVDALSAAGLPVIEVTAFVSPRWVPQMADAVDVLSGISRRPGTRYTALVPNVKGLERALTSRLDAVAVFGAASETFSRRNINQSIDESMASFSEVCRIAREANLPVRGYLSTCFGCPFEGHVDPERVAIVSERLFNLGVYEVVLSDTIGVAHPRLVDDVVTRTLARIPADRIALHFHDTRGTALANVLTGLMLGISTYDTATGGLGGCPFAPGATGNVATEDVLYMLDGLGIETGVSLNAVVQASRGVEDVLGRTLPSRYYRAHHAAAAVQAARS